MPVIGVIITIVVGIAQMFAFIDGMEELFNSGMFISLIAFFFAYAIPLVGQLFVLYVTYIGASAVWDWEWWQAVLLCAPTLVLMAVLFATDALSSLFRKD